MALGAQVHVVITGIGVVAPNGIGQRAFWDTLLRRQSGVKTISLFDASRHGCTFAGEVSDFSAEVHLAGHPKPNRLSRQSQFALAAAREALADAGVRPDEPQGRAAVPVILGISSSAIEIVVQAYGQMTTRGEHRISPHLVNASQPQQSASLLAQLFSGPTTAETMSSACASGLDAIGAAAARIAGGMAELALCGGADCPLNAVTFASLHGAGLAQPSPFPPAHACRPFDRGHTAGAIAEGAVIFVLERRERAAARGARIYAEIAGYGTRMDPDPDRPGSGLGAAMRAALNAGSRLPADISCISAHGPGHPVLDVVETEEIHEVFGRHARRVPVVSIKGVTGNPLAAGGAMQVAAACLSIRHGILPPTANHEQPAPACDLDYVGEGPRPAAPSCVLVNAHGLGNGNTSLLVDAPT